METLGNKISKNQQKNFIVKIVTILHHAKVILQNIICQQNTKKSCVETIWKHLETKFSKNQRKIFFRVKIVTKNLNLVLGYGNITKFAIVKIIKQ